MTVRTFVKRHYPRTYSVGIQMTNSILPTYASNIGTLEDVAINACSIARPQYFPGSIRFGYDEPTVATTIGSSALVSPANGTINSNYNYFGTQIKVLGTGFPDGSTTYPTPPTGANADMAYGIDFNFNGGTFEVHYKALNSSGSMAIMIDGQMAASGLTMTGTAGNIYYRRFYVPTGTTKNIKIFGAFFGFRGIQKGTTATLTTTPLTTQRMIVIGDSFTEGIFANAMYTGWAWRLGDLMGIRDTWNSGLGGTGYANPGTAGRDIIGNRLVSDVTNYNPNWIIFAAGINDTTSSVSTVSTNSASCFATARTNCPTAKIVVLGPFISIQNHATNSLWINTRDAIKASALANGADLFVDPLDGSWTRPNGATGNVNSGLPWRTGNGYLTNYQSTGNSSLFTASDGTHNLEQACKFDAYKAYRSIIDSGI